MNLKRALIFCLTFLLSSILITFVMIHFENNKISNDNKNYNNELKEETEEKESNEKVIDLEGVYNQNDLIIKEEIIVNSEECKIVYPKLEGLKDKVIEEKINSDIKKRLENLRNSHDVINRIDFFVEGNFANVLSLEINVDYQEFIDNESNDTLNQQMYANYESVGFNYNLVSGERLKIEDLFKTDTALVDIVRKAFYATLHNEIYLREEEHGVNAITAKIDENEFYKVVNSYMKLDDKPFTFSPKGIKIIYQNYYSFVSFIDIADEVTIYDKYKTEESIFERDDIGYKNIFTCANIELQYFDKANFGLDENVWFDYIVDKHFFDDDIIEEEKIEFDKFKNQKVDEFIKQIEDEKNKFKEDKDNFYIILGKLNVYPSNYFVVKNGFITYKDGKDEKVTSNIAGYQSYMTIYKFPKELYENEYKQKIIDAYRDYSIMGYGLELDLTNEKGVTTTKNEIDTIYNYKTGKRFNTLKDVFKDVSVGENLLKEKAREGFEYLDQSYTPEEIENFINDANYTITSYGIVIKIDGIEDFYEILHYEDIDYILSKLYE